MPIRYSDPVAILEGQCAPEEADALLEWLRRTPEPAADLRACEAPHTALVQLLLAARVRLAAAPADPILAACLAAHFPGTAVPEPPPQYESRGGTGNEPAVRNRVLRNAGGAP